MSAAKIITAIQRDDATIGAAIDTRAFQADAVPRRAERPYTAYRVDAIEPDRDLNGTLNGYTVSAVVDIVAETYEECEALQLRYPLALDAVRGTTVAGFAVTGAEAGETGDEIDGPVDVNGSTAFIGSVQVAFYYEV